MLPVMTLHTGNIKTEVGVRELHDHLSRYVHHVQNGAEIVVTMRGRRVARLVPVDGRDPLAELRARGLVREPTADRGQRSGRSRLTAAKPVSDLVEAQRR
jgi:prevent-host-death family protein